MDRPLNDIDQEKPMRAFEAELQIAKLNPAALRGAFDG